MLHGFSGLIPRIPGTVYRYFRTYPFLLFSFSFPQLFSCWFCAVDQADLYLLPIHTHIKSATVSKSVTDGIEADRS